VEPQALIGEDGVVYVDDCDQRTGWYVDRGEEIWGDRDETRVDDLE
jgi:hypothetical protein